MRAKSFRFAIYAPSPYLRATPWKNLELPAAVARAFVEDMRAFVAENAINGDGIAAATLRMLKQHYSGKLRLHDAKAMFRELTDQA